MNALTKRLHDFLSQDIARHNAATAASQAMRDRRQRAEVEAFLAQAGRPVLRPGAPSRRSSAG